MRPAVFNCVRTLVGLHRVNARFGPGERPMGRKILSALVAGVFACAGAAHAEDAPVQVMILGTVHMDNPALDLHNTKVGDVLEPDFQTQIARVTNALGRFRPTAVDVESPPDAETERYALFLADKLAPSRNEIVQLGFRLARTAGLQTVNGVDADAPFPFPAVREFAKAHGQEAALDAMNTTFEALARTEEALLKTEGLAAVLRRMNDPARIRSEHSFYRSLLRIGSGQERPGAELLAEWYRRNFLICFNILQASKPGDRIVVIFGSGHSFLLRQCVSETPGLQLVETNDYLPE